MVRELFAAVEAGRLGNITRISVTLPVGGVRIGKPRKVIEME